MPLGRSIISMAGKSTVVFMLALMFAGIVQARVIDIEILDEQNPTFDGMEFGNSGTYRRIHAIIRYAVDPQDPTNSNIVDLDKARRNTDGEIEFSGEVVILQPSDPEKGNHRLFFEISNRGRNLSFPLVNDSPFAPNPSTAKETGNAFLMEQGYTIAWSGWQPDLAGDLVSLSVPVARGVTGMSREEFIFDNTDTTSRATLSYPAADLDPTKATLTVRINERDPRRTPAGLSFSYIGPGEIEIRRPAGLSAGAIYEFIYPAKNSLVTGLAFAAVRDLVSFLRSAPSHEVSAPVARIEYVIGMGISQAGRFARDFIYQGFNVDEGELQVFDGMLVHIAGSRKTFTNARFAQPGRYSRQHEDHSYPGDQFPFTYAETFDPLTRRSDGILKQCEMTATCPRIMHSDSDTEFWQARASLVVTDPAGMPASIPSNVRIYYLAGTQHYVTAEVGRSTDSTCLFENNVIHPGAFMRALLQAMDHWITYGLEPPANRFPDRVGYTLVKPGDLAFPTIPSLDYKANINHLQVLDHRSLPPVAGEHYPVFVANVDIDGNSLDGVKLPEIAVPLATHTGWNLRTKDYAEGELCGLSGSFIPLARQASEKTAQDFRPAVDQLYRDENHYLAKIEAAIADLKVQHMILEKDADMLRERARKYWQMMSANTGR